MRMPMGSSYLFHCCVAIACAWFVTHLSSQLVHAQPALKTYKGPHYIIHSNLPLQEIRPLAQHMSTTYVLYERKFRQFAVQNNDPMPLYLIDTRENYYALLESFDINATNSGGIFFVRPNHDASGLATYVYGKNRNETIATLQHEGFHQFAYKHIGHDLPIWANEGIAQYFEDGLLVQNRMILGRGDPHRIALIQHAVKNNQHVPFDEFLQITPQEWSTTLNQDAKLAGIYYAQAWSIVDMLVNSGRDDWQKAFVDYLKRVSLNEPSHEAFRNAFNGKKSKRPAYNKYTRRNTSNTQSEDDPDTNAIINAFGERWIEHVQSLKPDPFIVAIERMEFLAGALAFMQKNDVPMPHSITDLRDLLKRSGFYSTRTMHGIKQQYHGSDEKMYRFETPRRGEALFRLLEPTRNDLPPRVTAPGLVPEPTIAWQRKNGELTHHLEYR